MSLGSWQFSDTCLGHDLWQWHFQEVWATCLRIKNKEVEGSGAPSRTVRRQRHFCSSQSRNWGACQEGAFVQAALLATKLSSRLGEGVGPWRGRCWTSNKQSDKPPTQWGCRMRAGIRTPALVPRERWRQASVHSCPAHNRAGTWWNLTFSLPFSYCPTAHSRSPSHPATTAPPPFSHAQVWSACLITCRSRLTLKG